MTTKRWLDLGLMALFPLLYVCSVRLYFWTLPAASDSLEYLGSVVWGSTVGYYPWFDRLNLGSGLQLAYALLPGAAYETGQLYPLLISTLTLVISQLWLYLRVGFGAACFMGVIACSSWYFQYFGSQIFPEPTMIFYALLAVICSIEARRERRSLYLLAGAFTAMACFSKATAFLLPVVMAGVIFREFRFKIETGLYLAGVVLGAFFSMGLYALCYGWTSLQNTIELFFGHNVQSNFAGREGFNNAVSYYDTISDPLFLPVFLGLLVSIGAYRHAFAKRILVFAWTYVLSIYFIHMITNRGYVVISNYIYPGYFFTALACSAYWGEKVEILNTRQKILFALSLFAALLLGLNFGFQYNPSDIFKPNYFSDFPRWIPFVYNTGLIALVGALVWGEIARCKKALRALALLTSFWTAAYAGGRNRHQFTTKLNPEVEFYYHFAPALNAPTARSVDVYVESWNRVENADRLLWVYRIFFDQKYNRSQGQAINEADIKAHIHFLVSQADIPAGRGEQILTDNPALIQTLLKESALVKEFDCHGLKLFVFERAR